VHGFGGSASSYISAHVLEFCLLLRMITRGEMLWELLTVREGTYPQLQRERMREQCSC
jgi:hypothetical protein